MSTQVTRRYARNFFGTEVIITTTDGNSVTGTLSAWGPQALRATVDGLHREFATVHVSEVNTVDAPATEAPVEEAPAAKPAKAKKAAKAKAELPAGVLAPASGVVSIDVTKISRSAARKWAEANGIKIEGSYVPRSVRLAYAKSLTTNEQ